MRKLTLLRDVTQSECSWLECNLKAGWTFWEYTGCTYGCIDTMKGIAATWMTDQTPFFQIPRDAIAELREPTLADACDWLTGAKEYPDDRLPDMTPSPAALKRRKAAEAAARRHGPIKRKKIVPNDPVETGLF